MHSQIAEVELVRSYESDVARPVTAIPVVDQFPCQKRQLVPARGILTAALFVTPFWALVALALYLII
jgi:hypothetical protein